MAIVAETLLAWSFPDVFQQYDQRDAMLYGLSIGLGTDPGDTRQLCYVYEKSLLPFPTMAVTLGGAGPWTADPRTGITRSKLVYAAHKLEIHKPMPPEAEIRGTNRVSALVDKGKGRGALVYVERELFDAQTGEQLGTQTASYYCRADGGFDPDFEVDAPVQPILPDRVPDTVLSVETSLQAALLYRLNGDINPLHADPDYAKKAGFPRPILHGLCTYGIVVQHLIGEFCNYDAGALQTVEASFSSPVLPGDTLDISVWQQASSTEACRSLLFSVSVEGKTVMDKGQLVLASG